MKKILLTIVFLATVCIGGQAQDYYIQGETNQISNNWTATVAGNKMSSIDYNGTKRYWIAKKLTVSGSTTIKFRAYRNDTGTANDKYITYNNVYDHNSTGDNASQNDAATLYFKDAGDYWVIFTIDLNNDSSLDAIVMANLSQDFNNGDNPLWTEQTMEFSTTDNFFHVKKEVHITTAGQQGRFKAKVWHRSTANDPVWYGTAGYSSVDDWDIYVNEFPEIGDYEIEFLLDPVKKTAPWYRNVKGFRDVTINANGYATLSSHTVLDVPTGVTAHYIDGEMSPNHFSTKTTTKIPKTTSTPGAGTGVILTGNTGTYRFYWSSDQDTPVTLTGNKLSGTGNCAEPGYHVDASTTYCFTEKDGTVGFYLAVAGNYAPFKAFLPKSSVSSAREFIGINFDDESPLSVDAVREQSVNDRTYYNLQGQPVAHPTKGLYIVGGRKVMVK